MSHYANKHCFPLDRAATTDIKRLIYSFMYKTNALYKHTSKDEWAFVIQSFLDFVTTLIIRCIHW